VNVADQLDDADSLLSFYRRLLRVRRENPALIAGDYVPLNEDQDDYLAFARSSAAHGQTCLVVLNMSLEARTVAFDLEADSARLLFSSRDRSSETEDLSRVAIAPFEIYIAEIPLGRQSLGKVSDHNPATARSETSRIGGAWVT
jgi:hypothetical protein